MLNPLLQLREEGVSVWLDDLSRDLLRSGRLARYIEEDGLRGETSNPTIFRQAVSASQDYDESILELARRGMSAEEICWELMIADVQSACDLFRPLYEETGGEDGFVSLELNPTLAHDTRGSLRQARELRARVDRPNVMFKVPATPEGLPVVEELIADGFNINITLLFNLHRYEEVIEAYMRGLERRLSEGGSLEHVASVASFFVSRVDTEVDRCLDRRLQEDPGLGDAVRGLRGLVAVANAQAAYGRFLERFSESRWKRLEERGARVQRPLWASTSTKNPRYSDILYVRDLVGPRCVNTMPESTLEAFRDHGVVRRTLTGENISEAHAILGRVREVGVDLEGITRDRLVREGVRKFADSYRDLVAAVETERSKLLSRA